MVKNRMSSQRASILKVCLGRLTSISIPSMFFRDALYLIKGQILMQEANLFQMRILRTIPSIEIL